MGRYASGLIDGLLSTHPDGDYAIAYNNCATANVPAPLREMPQYSFTLSNKPWRLRTALTHFGGPRMDASFSGVALYHSTGHLLPRFRRVRTVFTLHDLIPLLLPQYHRPLNRIFFRQMFPRFLQRADAIIAVSENTKNDAISLLGINPESITVIPEGISPSFRPVANEKHLAAVRAAYGLPETFILCVSTIEPRKNHTTLLRAFEMLHPLHPNVALVLAGNRGWLYRGFLDELQNSPVRHHVRLLGKVPETDLPALLSAATVFAFPSRYEGFGLPPLEAMACGTPVVCSNSSSLPEAVGDAVILCEPGNASAWEKEMTRLLRHKDMRQQLVARGRSRAATYTWDSAALATRSVYERVLAL